MNISNEAKCQEAILRMTLMGIFPLTIKQFRDEGHVSISEPPLGQFYWAEGEDLEHIRQFEAEHGALVYMVIRDFTGIGKKDSMLFVSDHPEEWEADRNGLRFGQATAYVYNVDAPDRSRISVIGFTRTGGSGLRLTRYQATAVDKMLGEYSADQDGLNSNFFYKMMQDMARMWEGTKKELGLDITEKANRAEMMDEAVERMKMLGLPEDAIIEFQKNGRPSLGMENGQYFPLSDSEKAQIKKLEGNEEYLVYAVVRNDSSYGKMTNYIVVSRHKCDWGLDRMNLTEHGSVMAYVYNCDFPVNSEWGTIEVKRYPDGMLDRKME